MGEAQNRQEDTPRFRVQAVAHREWPEILAAAAIQRHHRQIDAYQQPEVLARSDLTPTQTACAAAAVPMMFARAAISTQVVRAFALIRAIARCRYHQR